MFSYLHKLVSALAMLSLSILAGCGSLQSLNLSQGMKDIRAAQAEEGTAKRQTYGQKESIQLVVAAPPRLVAAGRVGREGESFREAYPFVVPDAEGNPPPFSDKDQVQPTNVKMGLDNFDIATKRIIEYRLAERFKKVIVKVSATGIANPEQTVVEPRVEVRWPEFGYIAAVAELKVTKNKKVLITVKAESDKRHTTKHLAWAIPVAVITFPIGLFVLVPVGSSIKIDCYQESLAEALDRAAVKLADHFAGEQGNKPSP